jgi:hypothetical protein
MHKHIQTHTYPQVKGADVASISEESAANLKGAFKDVRKMLTQGNDRLFLPYIGVVVCIIQEAQAQDPKYDPHQFMTLEDMTLLREDVRSRTHTRFSCCTRLHILQVILYIFLCYPDFLQCALCVMCCVKILTKPKPLIINTNNMLTQSIKSFKLYKILTNITTTL